MDTVEILIQALGIISNPERWTQGTFARDITGDSRSYLSYAAVRFCAAGAIFKCIRWDGAFPVRAIQYLDEAALQMASSNSVGVNDKLGHAAVIRMFERAIELARVESAVQPEPEEELVTV